MTVKLNRVRLAAVTASMMTLLGSASQLDAAPTALEPVIAQPEIAQPVVTQPVIVQQPTVQSIVAAQPQTVVQAVVQPVAEPAVVVLPDEALPASAASLAALVTAQPQPADLPRELNCLAGAVYFEAKSEALTGQLAVGRVIVARSKSGRFPNSYCGVVFQRAQFSFVRGGGLPGIDRRSKQWRNAVAIAQIAHGGTWRSPVEGALFFHAAHVSPSWKRTRMAQVQNHVFYR